MSKQHFRRNKGSDLGIHGQARGSVLETPRDESHPVARECCPRQRMAIEQYVAQHVAPAAGILHEIRSEIVHVDVHIVPPCAERPYWFLFTTGMSALPMRVPANMGLVPHAELSLMLPEWWQVDREAWKHHPKWFWPIRELFALAVYPHRHQTWIGEGHTIANCDPPCPYDTSTRLSGMLIMPFSLLGDEEPNVIDECLSTVLLALWPLHADELEYKRANGVRGLWELLEAAGVSPILDPARPSALAHVASQDLVAKDPYAQLMPHHSDESS